MGTLADKRADTGTNTGTEIGAITGADTRTVADLEPPSGRRSIGIIAGSGPEAGVDLWSKVLRHNQDRLGPSFRGDLDAPDVLIRSDPVLGLSMELEQNEAIVWERLKSLAEAVSAITSAYAIACNTLNYFAPLVQALDLPSELISFQSEVAAYIRRKRLGRVCLLGAAPVSALGKWSPYRDLSDLVAMEQPADIGALHRLIYDIKRLGPSDPSLRPRFIEILTGIESDTVVLACTELPLIADVGLDKILIDPTDLVARALVARSFAEPEPVSGSR